MPPTRQADAPTGLAPEVHETIRPVLVAFFRRRVSDAHEIEDLVQDVFLRLVRRGDLAHDDNVVGYAFRTAQSVLLDRGRYRRSRQSDRHVAFDPDLHGGVEVSAEEALLARDTLRDAASALGDLPVRVRQVFLLRRVDGLAMKAIADQLGISLSTAEKDLQRAALHLVQTRRRRQ